MSKKIVTIRINDEVNCVVMGLSNDHKKYFWEKYGIHVPGYHFSPKYQMKQWDGKIRFFTKTGQTYMYLLDDIIPRIIGLGYKVKVSDLRKANPIFPDPIDENFFSDIIDEKTGLPWVMRDYQVDMVNALLENGSGIGIAGTGAGKTSMTAAIALSYEKAGNLRSIIIVPDKNLTVQTIREYAFFGLDVGQYSGDKKDYDHQHVVSTWQSLNNNKTLIQQFDVVIVDECHGAKARVIKELLVKYGKNIPYRFGVTGTLPKERSDALGVHTSLGKLHYEIKAHQLISDGHLANLDIDISQLKVDLSFEYQQYLDDTPELPLLTYRQFANSYFPDWTAEKNYLHSIEDRTEWIANKIEERRSGGKGNTLCLVNGINYGKKLGKMIDGAIFLHGKDAMKVRQEAFNLFKERDDVVVIATIQIASTGLDIPRIFNLFYIDVGRSFIRTIQTIGRGLRKAHDKEHVNIFDICSDTKHSKKHLFERIKYYKEAQYPHGRRTIEYY
jgi:superfamily II DNA or RNA helicase